jgi:hypothetical protein
MSEFGVADLIDAILSDERHHVRAAANGRQGLPPSRMRFSQPN